MFSCSANKPEPRKYAYAVAREKTEMKGCALSEEQPALVQQRATAMSAAVDRTIVEKKEDLTIDSPEKLINQKSREALSVAQKWSERSAQLEQKSSSINKEEIVAILQEAKDDLEYWMSQKEKIEDLLSKNDIEENKRNLFLILIAATNQGIERAHEVAGYYAILPESLCNQASARGQLFSSVINPLNAGQASDSRSQQLGQLENHKTKVIKIPSKLSPLIADTLQEVLETWSGDAEIRYDSSNSKYVSEQFQPNNMFDVMICAAARTQLEREQHRDAIEKVALKQGLDRGARFKNHFSIRVKSVFGAPLTPRLIGKVQQDLRREDSASECDAIIYPSGLSTFGRFLEGIAARWESFRSRGRNRSGYETIPSDYVEVKSEIIHHRQVHSGSYQALQPGSLDASNGNRDSREF